LRTVIHAELVKEFQAHYEARKTC